MLTAATVFVWIAGTITWLIGLALNSDLKFIDVAAAETLRVRDLQ